VICYQGALSFWTAAAPRLAADLPEMQKAKRALVAGDMPSVVFLLHKKGPQTNLGRTHRAKEFVRLDTMSRNRVFNVAFAVCSLGELVVLAVLAGILVGIQSVKSYDSCSSSPILILLDCTTSSDSGTEANTRALNIVVAYSAAIWGELLHPEVPNFNSETDDATFHNSRVRDPLVRLGTPQAWLEVATGHDLRHSRLQESLVRPARGVALARYRDLSVSRVSFIYTHTHALHCWIAQRETGKGSPISCLAMSSIRLSRSYLFCKTLSSLTVPSSSITC
jgi:hypothetical protein